MRWIAIFHRDGDEFEYSVCIEDYHGTISFGWEGPEKIIVLEGSFDDYGADERRRARKRAKFIAQALNQ